MVLETLFFSPFNHLTRLVAREDFIIHEGDVYDVHPHVAYPKIRDEF
jgi:hypothetical protein